MGIATIKIFKAAGKELVVQAVNVQGEASVKIPDRFGRVFKEIAPFLKNKRQAVYICDDPNFGMLKGRAFPNAYALSKQRIEIFPNRWPVIEKYLTDSLAHEIHHLARGQHGFWYKSLGHHLALDGMACLYAETVTGIRPPWIRRRLSHESVRRASREWTRSYGKYDVHDWFMDPKGSMGRWAGYRLGYELARRYFKGNFDLRESIMIKPDALLPILNDLAHL